MFSMVAMVAMLAMVWQPDLKVPLAHVPD